MSGSCRLCRAYCDWVVEPGGCVDRGCPSLYAYDDAGGRRIIGCVERVFTAELDLAVMERVRAAAPDRRFGGLRAARRPLPVCRAEVQRAYVRRLPVIGCVNPEFAEPHDGPAFRVVAADR
jgi:hypothetical protein